MLRKPAFQSSRKLAAVIWAVLGMTLAACSLGGAPATPATAAATDGPLPTQVELSATPQRGAQAAPTASPEMSGQLRLGLASEGNEARYRVREQLASLSFPSDAIGATSAITGKIVVNANGSIVRDESKFVVDLTTLKSDQDLRDNYLQRNTLQTRQYPAAEYVPAQAIGLPSPLPTAGEIAFQLVGDMTLHGVTRPTTWEVTAQVVNGRELVGSAVTRFTFADFNLTIPRVGRVLSIEDNIQLELDFHLVVEGG